MTRLDVLFQKASRHRHHHGSNESYGNQKNNVGRELLKCKSLSLVRARRTTSKSCLLRPSKSMTSIFTTSRRAAAMEKAALLRSVTETKTTVSSQPEQLPVSESKTTPVATEQPQQQSQQSQPPPSFTFASITPIPRRTTRHRQTSCGTNGSGVKSCDMPPKKPSQRTSSRVNINNSNHEKNTATAACPTTGEPDAAPKAPRRQSSSTTKRDDNKNMMMDCTEAKQTTTIGEQQNATWDTNCTPVMCMTDSSTFAPRQVSNSSMRVDAPPRKALPSYLRSTSEAPADNSNSKDDGGDEVGTLLSSMASNMRIQSSASLAANKFLLSMGLPFASRKSMNEDSINSSLRNARQYHRASQFTLGTDPSSCSLLCDYDQPSNPFRISSSSVLPTMSAHNNNRRSTLPNPFFSEAVFKAMDTAIETADQLNMGDDDEGERYQAGGGTPEEDCYTTYSDDEDSDDYDDSSDDDSSVLSATSSLSSTCLFLPPTVPPISSSPSPYMEQQYRAYMEHQHNKSASRRRRSSANSNSVPTACADATAAALHRHLCQSSSLDFAAMGLPSAAAARSQLVSKFMVESMPSTGNLSAIQVEPGVYAQLRGAQETWESIHIHDFYKSLSCTTASCRAELCCIRDVGYVLCPLCRGITKSLSGFQQMKQQGTQDPSSGSSTATTTIGVGFTLEDLRQWELQEANKPSNKTKRGKRRGSSTSNHFKNSKSHNRRPSMQGIFPQQQQQENPQEQQLMATMIPRHFPHPQLTKHHRQQTPHNHRQHVHHLHERPAMTASSPPAGSVLGAGGTTPPHQPCKVRN